MNLIRPLLVSALFSITGCVTTGDITEKDIAPVALSKGELQELLVDRTYPFSKGGMYFSSESEATIQWDGKTEDVAWHATDAGTFCYAAEIFGGQEECIRLKKTGDGNFLHEFEGKQRPVKASEIVDGKSF